MTKLTVTNKCTSVAARFEGLADAPEQYRWHRPMQHVQGYSGSHWTPALGNYYCSVSPQRLPRQQANKQQSTNAPKKVAVLIAMAMHRYVTVHITRWRRFRALLDDTKRHHWASIAANHCNQSCMCQFFTSFFIVNLYKKVAG
jgi:hypothetical protein